MKTYKYLMIGGGMTADAAVKGIREIDGSGTIGIISAEQDPPYARPPLSKALWTKKGKTVDDIGCRTAEKGADVLTSTRAVAIDTAEHQVLDDKGETYRYERLLLATGAKPNHLQFDAGDVFYYRTLCDYRRLRERAQSGQHFAVLGGGFIGVEIASALAINGLHVSMIFPEASICGRLLPPVLSASLSQYYEQQGVTLIPGRKPSSIDTKNGVQRIHLENGHTFSVDGIVAGIGVVPDTQLAEDAGFEINNGIVVDEQLRTSHPHVFAAGDVANFYNPQLDKRMRVEHEDNALTMGKMAGRNMAGEAQRYHHLPFFYSDLFDAGYEAVGETGSSLDVITKVKEPEDKGCIFYLKDKRVRGVVFWNLFGNVEAGRELIATPGLHTGDDLHRWAVERLRH